MRLGLLSLLLLLPFAMNDLTAQPQEQALTAEAALPSNAARVAEILGITSQVERLQMLRASHQAGTPPGAEELVLRQEIHDAVLTASLDIDGVLGEIENERARVSELRMDLSGRRDRAVNRTAIANLITGTGLGIITNAMQFSNTTAKPGDVVGVVSGIGSTFLSILGIRQQRGPLHAVGAVPNMLAVPLGRKPLLYSDYPDDVLKFLNSPPPLEKSGRTRLQLLVDEWVSYGHLSALNTSQGQKKADLVTSSLNTQRKLTIDDLSDRGSMLADLAGRISLMKRDLAELMRSVQSVAPGQAQLAPAGGMTDAGHERFEW